MQHVFVGGKVDAGSATCKNGILKGEEVHVHDRPALSLALTNKWGYINPNST